jgi:hypothetical protein
VSEQQDNKSAPLDDVSDELTRSLQACHSLVDDYRLKLAANSHDIAANDGDASQAGIASAD